MSILRLYRHRLLFRGVIIYLVFAHLGQIFLPNMAFALTSGPEQEEFKNFVSVGTSGMVDPFTGSFNYNIPLIDVGGYPINLSYVSGGSMDTEASYVGYNWNLGIGALNHQIQVTPDDFKGDVVKREFRMKPNTTIGITASTEYEVFGAKLGKVLKGLQVSLGVYHNNYTGFGYNFGLSPAFNVVKGEKGTLTAGLSLGYDSKAGATAGVKLSFSDRIVRSSFENGVAQATYYKPSVGIGGKFNSRKGLKQLSINASNSGERFTWDILNDKHTHEKRKKGKVSASMSFASPTFSPQLTFPFLTAGYAFNGTIGGDFTSVHPDINFQGHVSSQFLLKKKIDNQAYGYAYLDYAPDEFSGGKNVTLDFNRENDGPYIQSATPNLAVTRPGFDMYLARGHGVGGTFRAFRDPGTFHDPYMATSSVDLSGGLEIGGGNLIHWGGNVSGFASQSTTGRWSKFDVEYSGFGSFTGQTVSANALKDIVSFKSKSVNEPAFEPYYFKQLGETSLDADEDYYKKLGEDLPVRVSIADRRVGLVAKQLEDDKGGTYASNAYGRADYGRDEATRAKRTQNFQMLTATEAEVASLNSHIRNHKYNDFTFKDGILDHDIIHRTEDERRAHHFSAGIVTRGDGMQHIYDIPAYNWAKKEATFNVAGNGYQADCESGLISYKPGEDNSVKNDNGIDEFFQANTTPAYAHTYLLTGVLSPDYVDKTGDGITDDDLGQAFQINYHRHDKQFDWRAPLGTNKATFNTGYDSRGQDDKASYVYGQKELWYPHSIVSRHYIAEFTYDNTREDGLGVVDENGQVDANSGLLRLEKITLYAKKERIEKGSNAVPIKTVHFEHNYELCEGVPNNLNGGGKLTLKKVYFTYGKSDRGKYNPYQFFYADPNHQKGNPVAAYNPSYQEKSYDRWGNYKPQDCTLPNQAFPYVEQDGDADIYAQAWLLHTIQTPSGGTINVDYEAHDYGFVQDKRAMRMMKIKGFADDSTATSYSNLLYYRSNGEDKFKSNDFVFVDLPVAANDDDDFKKKYLYKADGKKMKDLYFSFKMPIEKIKNNNSSRAEDRIAGFAEVADGGLVNGSTTVGWVKIKKKPLKKEGDKTKVNGIARKAWNFIRMNLPERLFPGDNMQTGSDEEKIKGLGGFFMEMKAMFRGYYRVMRDRGFADYAKLDESWIRLFEPDWDKEGGNGARVKQIYTSDEWGEMIGNAALSNTYGQQYTYTTYDKKLKKVISSGVANFEPLFGADESPFAQPISFKKKVYRAENDEYHLIGPLVPYAYPAASVGYREVRIESLDKTGVSKHATGHVVKKFYTSKEFPTEVKFTELDAKSAPKIKRLKKIHYAWASQGVVIKRNDMHGKPYMEEIFAENAAHPISGVTYTYRTEKPFDSSLENHLKNTEVPVVKRDGSVTTGRIGYEMEFMLDERQQQTRAAGISPAANLENFLLAFFPSFPIPSIFFIPHYEHTRARFMFATKIINQYGLMDKVEAFEGGAKVSTINKAYDAETGAVLLTETKNEFDQDIYSFTYPAHWAYDRMGQAYQNIDMEWSGPVNLNNIANADQYFVKGDVLLLDDELGWVLDVVGNNQVYVVDRKGVQITGTFDKVKIVESGRSNQAATSVGGITTMQNPISGNQLTFDKVINAGVAEFSDRWQIQCGTPEILQECVCKDLTIEAIDLRELIEAVAQNGLLMNSNINLNSFPNAYLASSLPAAILPSLGTNCFPEWRSTSTPTSNNCTQQMQIQIGENCNGSFTPALTVNLEVAANNPLPLCLDYANLFENMVAVIDDSTQCQDDFAFTMDGLISYCQGDGGSVDTLKLTGDVDAFPIRDCDMVPKELFSCVNPGDTLNPYTRGIRGTWRPLKTYTYLTGRTNQGPSPLMPTQIDQEGWFTSFNPFWFYTGSEWDKNATNWQWTAEATKYIPQGKEVESVDPLGRYSAAIFGYSAQVPVAKAANARNTQIAFANFEAEEDYLADCQAPVSFANATGLYSEDYAHTGKRSIILTAGLDPTAVAINAEAIPETTCVDNGIDPVPFLMDECDCAGTFKPTRGEDYLLTFWVHGDSYHSGQAVGDYPDLDLVIELDGTVLTPAYHDRGTLLDGWQRHEVRFHIPAGTSKEAFEIRFLNQLPAGTGNLYLDDVMVQPFLSGMQAYVYHPRSLKLMAALDGNGYATLYQYDQEGNLYSVKRETERGIQSLNESRNFVKPELGN